LLKKKRIRHRHNTLDFPPLSFARAPWFFFGKGGTDTSEINCRLFIEISTCTPFSHRIHEYIGTLHILKIKPSHERRMYNFVGLQAKPV
jgi:hypothetical protein